jgi:hypothetical protein
MKLITPAILFVAACGVTRPRPITLARGLSVTDDDSHELVRKSPVELRRR